MLLPNRLEVMGNRADESNGPGKLAQAIVDYEHGIPHLEVEAVSLPENPTVLVYARKNDGTLKNAVEYCSDTETPLIFLSSGIDLSKLNTPDFPFIKVPNAALGVIAYLNQVQEAASTEYAGWIPQIVEHHQEAKADTSGTAKKLAEMLDMDPSEIISVRDFTRSQEEYDIPDSSEDGFAVHSVTFRNPGSDEISEAFEMVIRGREDYAKGVIDIFRALQENPNAFHNGIHDIVDLVKDGVVKATLLKNHSA